MMQKDKTMMMKIRDAQIDDAAAIAEIYRPYVEQTMITAELLPPTAEQMAERIDHIRHATYLDKVGFPYLVCTDSSDEIVGYCYAHRFHERQALDRSAELSIYLSSRVHGQGIGRALYREMEYRLAKLGITNSYVSISYTEQENPHLTHASILFHEKMGYQKCAHFHNCAEKFGILFDVVWMEKFL